MAYAAYNVQVKVTALMKSDVEDSYTDSFDLTLPDTVTARYREDLGEHVADTVTDVTNETWVELICELGYIPEDVLKITGTSVQHYETEECVPEYERE